jgi:hypothetical protein
MGYNTHFDGSFRITPPLDAVKATELREFCSREHTVNERPCGCEQQAFAWCSWTVSEDGTTLEIIDGMEKCYDWEDWLQLLIDRFLKPCGCVLTGIVHWSGETQGDCGKVKITSDGKVQKIWRFIENPEHAKL